MNLQLFGLDDDKLLSFTFDHVGQVDELGKVTGNYVTIQQYLDSRGIDLQDAHNDLIDSLMDDAVAGATGASQLGVKATGVVASNVEDAIAEVQANVAGAVAGEIPNNTLTELKMAADMKKATGGVYPYDDGDQNATDIATNTSDIATNAEAIDEVVDIRVSTDTTGSADAYLVTVSSTFDFTLDGNVIRINPNFTNVGSSTLAVNGTTKSIRKFDIDTDAYVVLKGEDIKKNNPTELRYDVSEGFFVLAPKVGGGAIRDFDDPTTVYQPDIQVISTTTRETVLGSGWVLCIMSGSGASNFASLLIDGSYLLGSATESIRIGSGGSDQEPIMLIARYETSFELKTQVDDYTIIYLEGDKYEEGVTKVLSTTSAISTTLRETYIGEGWVTSLLSPTNIRNVVLRINNITISQFQLNETIALLLKFDTKLELRSNVDEVGITYITN